MLEKITYTNHLNESVVFGENGILISRNDVRDYEWGYNSQYNKITGFKRTVTKKTVPVLIYGENRNTLANHLFEVIEKDVLAGKNGRLIIGDYYMEGYFYGSKKSYYNDPRFLKFNLTFITTQNKWINGKTYVFRPDSIETGGDGLDYPFDYPHNYGSPIGVQNLINTNFVPSNFVIEIYGPASNPSVIIGGDVHRVYCTLQDNEYLTIDSLNKTITKTTINGTKVNQFYNRDIENYVFEKVKTGENSVIITPSCNVSITLLEERSEPAWT